MFQTSNDLTSKGVHIELGNLSVYWNCFVMEFIREKLRTLHLKLSLTLC